MKAGQIRRSGGFSDLQKRQDFEGRAPKLHEIFGCGTRGSPATTRFEQNPRVLFETLQPLGEQQPASLACMAAAASKTEQDLSTKVKLSKRLLSKLTGVSGEFLRLVTPLKVPILGILPA